MGIFSAIKYALNSTLGTDAFQPLDEMITGHGAQEFTSSGTFTVPKGVHKIWVTAAAGGQAGYAGTRGGESSSYYYFYGGAGGNGGDCILRQPYCVQPEQVIAITIGKGGTTSGGIGSATVIGNLVTLAGGNNTSNGSNNGGGAGGNGGYKPRSGSEAGSHIAQRSGRDGILGSGGAAAVLRVSAAPYGGGGGGSIGNGGNGAVSLNTSENVGMNGTKGGGGGGGYGAGSGSIYGKGGDGYCLIEW